LVGLTLTLLRLLFSVYGCPFHGCCAILRFGCVAIPGGGDCCGFTLLLNVVTDYGHYTTFAERTAFGCRDDARTPATFDLQTFATFCVVLITARRIYVAVDRPVAGLNLPLPVVIYVVDIGLPDSNVYTLCPVTIPTVLPPHI